MPAFGRCSLASLILVKEERLGQSSSVGKMLAVQAWEGEFGPQNPSKRAECGGTQLHPSAGDGQAERGRPWVLEAS